VAKRVRARERAGKERECGLPLHVGFSPQPILARVRPSSSTRVSERGNTQGVEVWGASGHAQQRSGKQGLWNMMSTLRGM